MAEIERLVRLEHMRQRVVPTSEFLLRLLRYLLFSLALMIVSLGIGILGYHYFAKLKWVDSFYMSAMILTGMGPIAEMTTNRAKIFSSFYALYSGIAFLSITAVFFAPIVHRLLHILHFEDDATKK